MKEDITFTLDDVVKIFEFLEKTNELFHQPMNFENSNVVRKFAAENYPEIRELYYNLIWEKLQKNIKDNKLSE